MEEWKSTSRKEERTIQFKEYDDNPGRLHCHNFCYSLNQQGGFDIQPLLPPLISSIICCGRTTVHMEYGEIAISN
jgi:hypothetical protein